MSIYLFYTECTNIPLYTTRTASSPRATRVARCRHRSRSSLAPSLPHHRRQVPSKAKLRSVVGGDRTLRASSRAPRPLLPMWMSRHHTWRLPRAPTPGVHRNRLRLPSSLAAGLLALGRWSPWPGPLCVVAPPVMLGPDLVTLGMVSVVGCSSGVATSCGYHHSKARSVAVVWIWGTRSDHGSPWADGPGQGSLRRGGS